MSSIMLQQSRVMLAELLLSEKESTRVWLRDEMARLVDPMLESIFNRLQTKLTNGLERTQSSDGGDGAQVGNPFDHIEPPNVPLHQPSSLIPHPSTATLNPQSNHQPPSIDYEPENDPEILAEVKREIEEERQMQLNMQNNNQIDNEQGDGEHSINCPQEPSEQEHQFQTNLASTEKSYYTEFTLAVGQMTNMDNDVTDRMDCDEPGVKEEFDETTTTELCNSNQFLVQPTEEKNEETNQTMPTGHHVQSFFYATESNEQPNHDIIEHFDRLPDKFTNESMQRNHFGDIRELAYSTEHDQLPNPHLSQSVALINEDFNEDYGDCVGWFGEDEDREQSSRPVKKARLDTTQPNQANNKQIITLGLQCAHCWIEFSQEKLNDHMKKKHDIGPFRCLSKDCAASFDNCVFLGEHIKRTHQHKAQWHCDKCQKHYKTQQILSNHNYYYHQLGHFQCSFPLCTFTGEYRIKVYHHYAQQHKQANCQYFGCHFQAPNLGKLKVHQRTHFGIKPYRCKWPQCDFAGARKSHTIAHIRVKHLTPKPGSVPNGAQLDLNDYFEVMHDLLESNQQPTQPNLVSKQDKQIITLSLQCSQTNCPDTFAGDKAFLQLNNHLWHRHSIKLARCLLKDCRQSFDNRHIISEHILHAHKHTTQWHCDKCPKHFSAYRQLYQHNTHYHQLGLFQCSFPSCTFTGECRMKVYSHYRQHKPNCQMGQRNDGDGGYELIDGKVNG